MVRFFFILSLFLVNSFHSLAQFTFYGFSQSVGTYSAISAGTVFGTVNSDDEVIVNPAAPAGQGVGTNGPGLPIGFNLFVNGNGFDRFGINCNGFIMLGQSASNPVIVSQISNAFTPISATSIGNSNQQLKIVAFGRDIEAQGAGSEIRAQTIGVSPNRTLVVQWSNYRKYGNPSGDNFNFQIRLCETTNNIEVLYGTFVNNTNAAQAQVGLRGGIPQDFNNRFVNALNTWPISAAGTTNTTVVNINSSLVPPSGLHYLWNPPPPCSVTPSGNTTQASAAAICPGGSATLSLINSYSLSGITYNWMASTTSSTGPYNPVPGAGSSFYFANGINSSTWYQCAVACVNGGGAIISSPVQVLTTGSVFNTIPYFEGFENLLQNNQLPNCSWAASNPTNICQTYIASASFNRVPRSGNKFASFRRVTNTNGDFFYTNALQLHAGVTYSATVWYVTDGAMGWYNFSMFRSSAQNTLALTPIATATTNVPGNLVNLTYAPLTNTFTVPSSGNYYLAIKCWGGTIPEYLSFDDLEVTAPCSLNQPSLTASASSSTLCLGNTVTLSASGANTYSWISGPATPVFTLLPGTSGTYSVVGTNTTTGCTAISGVSVDVLNSPLVSIFAPTTSVCLGSGALLTAFGASNYTWSNGANTFTTSVSPTLATVYTVSASNNNPCISSATVQIAVNPLPTLTVTAFPQTICAGESATLTASGALNYVWKLPTGIVLSPLAVVYPLTLTQFTLTGTNAFGCEASGIQTVAVNLCTGLNGDEFNPSGLKIYPVPTSGNIMLERVEDSERSYSIFDLNGGLVLSGIITNRLSRLNLNGIKPGAYLLKVEGYSNQKIIVIQTD